MKVWILRVDDLLVPIHVSWVRTPSSLCPLTILESYQPILGPSDLPRPLKSQEKSLWWGGGVEGENQIYCIAQVQVLKFLFKSLSSHDSDLTLTFLTLTWPSPDLHPTWTWTWAWQYIFNVLVNNHAWDRRMYPRNLDTLGYCRIQNHSFIWINIISFLFLNKRWIKSQKIWTPNL